MQFLHQLGAVARIEAHFFARFAQLRLAALVVACIPALYALIYLSSVWDPASHTESLAVGLVNLDQNMVYQGQEVNVGQEVMDRLKERHTFGFVDVATEESARQQVRQGALAFALIIPADFSSNAVPGAQPGAGRLVVYTSEGNNYQSAFLAKRFADDLVHAVNDSLNERRWALVIQTSAGSQRSVQRLRSGVAELREGAHALHHGSAKAADAALQLRQGTRAVDEGIDTLTDDLKEAATGLRAMDASRPKPAELQRLRHGSESLVQGHEELGLGVGELQLGSRQLVQGVERFRDQAADSWLVPPSVNEHLTQLHQGATQLDEGVAAVQSGQQKLTEGAKGLHVGVTSLTTAAHTLGNHLHTVVSKLPEDDSLSQLSSGSSQVRKGSEALAAASQDLRGGAERLAAGVDILMTSLPTALQTVEGSAEGMAKSVQPQVEVVAAVANQGSSFAPNVIPAALWLGAGIIAFLVHVRVMPSQVQTYSRSAQLLGKMLVPTGIVLLQAALVWLAVVEVLHITVLHPGALWAVLATASIAFLCIVFALTRALGDAGKALAMLFLAIQLSSSGGVLPVELSGGWFAQISPWLPMTWVVKALKASMFGAYDSAWEQPLLLIAATIVVALGSAIAWGRWRYVDATQMRPSVEF